MPKLPKSEKWIAHVECGVCGHSDALVKLDRRQYPYVYCPSCKSGIPTRSDKADRSIRSKMRLINRPTITSESESLESRESLVTHPLVSDPPMSHPPPVSPPPVSEKRNSPVAHSPDLSKARVLPKSPKAEIKNLWDIFQ